MKAIVTRSPGGLDCLELRELPDPGQPGPGQVRVKLHASSLNFHDLLVANGGIPAADVPRVFERGFTGQVGRAHGSATGMGLYLVASLCASMGLHVGLASEEGTGTRVILTFPHDRTRKELFGA